ncbi:MAG: glutaminyl-peptide cyclotransferase [Verrucomicrobiota bacterium]
MRLKSLASLVVAIASLASCQKSVPDTLAYQIVSTRPHDATSFTQGLQLLDGRLFESAGQYGESALREIDPATGKVLRKRPLAKTVFGEGLTILNKEMFVLTWKEHTAYVFDPETFKPIRSHTYQGEGWGLTNDGKQLIMSDGSSDLKFINPKDFSVIKTLSVKDGSSPLKNLNELEMIDGQIFANIYTTDSIARISPETGQVTGWLDLKGLKNQLTPPGRAEVLNGIAHDKSTGNLLVTGKYWPQMFEIKISKK